MRSGCSHCHGLVRNIKLYPSISDTDVTSLMTSKTQNEGAVTILWKMLSSTHSAHVVHMDASVDVDVHVYVHIKHVNVFHMIISVPS